MGTQTKTIQYRFDTRGNRSALIDHDGGRTSYAYDVVNRVTQVINPQGERTSYSYDAGGRRTAKKLANGTRASFTYDADSNLTKLYNFKSDGTVISSFDYKYDKVGNRKGVLEADGSRVTWSYDDADQLTGEHRTGSNPYRNTFTYDPAGNRLLKNHDGARTTYAYDAANQLTYSQDVSGRTTYTFDADGNQQVVREPSGNRTTYAWDYENRMTSVRLPTGIRNTMAYDADGLRVKLEESTGTKKFVWDDQNYLGETDAANDTQVVYTSDGSRPSRLISERSAIASRVYHSDVVGSIVALTDSLGTTTDTRSYDYWGTVVASAGSSSSRLRYLGTHGVSQQTDLPLNIAGPMTYSSNNGRLLSIRRFGRVVGTTRYSPLNSRRTLASLHAAHAQADVGGGFDPGFVRCLRDCQAACAEQFPSWWQYPSLLACVTACHTTCRDQSTNPLNLLCNYLADFSPCHTDLLHCVCLTVELEATVVNYILEKITPIFPPAVVLCVLNSLAECGCDALVTLQGICRSGERALPLGVISALDCITDIAGCVAGHVPGLGELEVLKDIILLIIETMFELLAFGHTSLSACCHLLSGECAGRLL